MQTPIAILIVFLCGSVVAWKIIQTLRGSGSMGSCCSKGCAGQAAEQAGGTNAAKGPAVHFVPLSALKRR